MILDGDDRLGREFDFAAVSGRIDAEVGNGGTAEANAKLAHDIKTRCERCAKVLDAANKIALEEIVGTDPIVIERPAESLDGVRRIVYAMEQNGLVVDGDAGVYDACEGVEGDVGKLADVVEMGVERGDGSDRTNAAG